MGLREKKAERTRQRIVAEALAMFTAQGYAETTMESIAEAAEIHPATLYRYFPSKDLIVLADFASTAERFADSLEHSPDDVALEDALMRAVVGVFEEAPDGQTHLERRMLRSIIDQSPAARARVWDIQDQQRRRVGAVIARRLGRQAHDFDVVLSARTVILILETAADIWRDSDGSVSTGDIARDLARAFRDGGLILPNPDA